MNSINPIQSYYKIVRKRGVYNNIKEVDKDNESVSPVSPSLVFPRVPSVSMPIFGFPVHEFISFQPCLISPHQTQKAL